MIPYAGLIIGGVIVIGIFVWVFVRLLNSTASNTSTTGQEPPYDFDQLNRI